MGVYVISSLTVLNSNGLIVLSLIFMYYLLKKNVHGCYSHEMLSVPVQSLVTFSPLCLPSRG